MEENSPENKNRSPTRQTTQAMEGNSPENVEVQPRSLMRQMLCALLINSVSFLQGASLSTSSIILNELQGNSSLPDMDLGVFNDFHITEEEGSWIGRKKIIAIIVCKS